SKNTTTTYNITILQLSKNSRNSPKMYIYIQGRTGGEKWPVRLAPSIHGAPHTQYTALCPLNTRRVAHSMHRTYRPVSGLLGKIPIHLTLFWMITKKLHH